MSGMRRTLLVALAMLAFAGNSVLCRLALETTTIDAASFTAIRLVSGALTLICVTRLRTTAANDSSPSTGSLLPGLALFVYAAAFSFAYVQLSTGTGALLLFGVVQVTMIAAGFARGERLGRTQVLGLALALIGLTAMLLPGAAAPSPAGAALMLLAGVAWASYSLLGRRATDPVGVTARNFLVAASMAVALGLALSAHARLDAAGIVDAMLSGAVTSGLGYVVWYTVLPSLSAMRAASVQLTVPVIAALAGAALLHEWPTARFALCSIAILGGIALVFWRKAAPRSA